MLQVMAFHDPTGSAMLPFTGLPGLCADSVFLSVWIRLFHNYNSFFSVNYFLALFLNRSGHSDRARASIRRLYLNLKPYFMNLPHVK